MKKSEIYERFLSLNERSLTFSDEKFSKYFFNSVFAFSVGNRQSCQTVRAVGGGRDMIMKRICPVLL